MPDSTNEPLIPATPGVALRNLQIGTIDAGVAQLLPDDQSRRMSKYIVRFPGWLEAGVSTRLSRNQAIHRTDDITVLFDGYLTDVVYAEREHKIALDLPALAILTLYEDSGAAAAAFALRGSFVALIIDVTAKTAHLITDRRASRPVFLRRLNGNFYAAAPTVTALARFPPTLSDVQPSAVLEFMMSMTFRGNSTLYREVHKLPYGATLRVHDTDSVLERYWALQFAVTDRNVDTLVEECDALLDQSAQRLLRTPEKKVLLLSGGTDSRVVLGYLRRHLGSQIDVACYWSELSDSDDAAIARELAEKYDLRQCGFEIQMKDFVAAAPIATLQSDCRSEVLDSAPLYQFWNALSRDFEGAIDGDHLFGIMRSVKTVQQALNRIGGFRLEQVCRLRTWLDPEISERMEEEIRAHLRDIVSQAREKNPEDLVDKLQYEERLGNWLNGFAWGKLHRLEVFRPLLDEDVIDFVRSLPNKWRDNKQLLRRLLKLKFPDLASIPPSNGNEMPTPQRFLGFLKSNRECRRFIEEQLTEKLDPRLASVFSTRLFKDTILAMLRGAPLPPIQRNWLTRLPGAWRLAKTPENRVDTFWLALRLLQLNVHLSSST